MKVKYISLAEKAFDVIMTSPFVQFLKKSIFLLLIREYQHTKFGLIWVKESKVTEGGGIHLPQVENVLNRPGEKGLKAQYFSIICWHGNLAP